MDKFLDEIWGVERLFIDENSTLNLDANTATILLCVSKFSFDKFISLVSFCEILKGLKLEISKFGVQKGQISAINSIKTLKISKFEVLNLVRTLRENGIIDKSYEEKVGEFLENLELLDSDLDILKSKNSLKFSKNLSSLNEIAIKLAKFDKKALISQKNANENEFIISVTGVINAGKSSMLNALLDSKILGASNIPETANLTLLRYSKDEKARVKFRDKSELEISLDELLNYTSAKYEISKDITLSELFLNNEFLKDKISIVDTPGLDDSVVEREILTKDFVKQSDAIIHLMNASQTATNKDTEFIIKTLNSSKNSELIVVLTHADKLKSSELIDALSYTKKSIENALNSQNLGPQNGNKIEFFAIDSLSKNGINALKNFIYNSFFGESSKRANLILNSYQKELSLIVQSLINERIFLISNLTKDRSQALEEARLINEKLEKTSSLVKEKNSVLNEALAKLDYSNFSFKNRQKQAILTIKDRVIAELSYSKKRKEKPNFSRLEAIVNNGINDLVVDILREIGVLVLKDLEILKSSLELDFEDESFDAREFWQKQNFKLLSQSLENLIKTERSLDEISAKFEIVLDEFFINFKLDDKISKLINHLTLNFKDRLKAHFDALKASLQSEKKALDEILSSKGSSIKDSFERVESLRGELKEIEYLKSELENVK